MKHMVLFLTDFSTVHEHTHGYMYFFFPEYFYLRLKVASGNVCTSKSNPNNHLQGMKNKRGKGRGNEKFI